MFDTALVLIQTYTRQIQYYKVRLHKLEQKTQIQCSCSIFRRWKFFPVAVQEKRTPLISKDRLNDGFALKAH